MIRTVAETGSTNDDMLDWAAHGARTGDWIVADRQTAGRGRLGRTWESPPGNLYASTLVRLRDGDPPAPTLALVAAIAAYHLVLGMLWNSRTPGTIDVEPLRIKWPNDIVYGKAKIGGILLERSGKSVVIGFGVNALHAPSGTGRPTTSALDLGAKLNFDGTRSVRWVLSNKMHAELLRWRWREKGGLAATREQWLRFAHPIGTPLAVGLPDGDRLEGSFDGLTEQCALILRLADGATRVIHAADVFLL